MRRLFLDANVLFTAAHNPKGKAALICELGRAGLWQLITSAYALEEARRNIARKYPHCLEPLENLGAALRLAPEGGSAPCPPPLPDKDCPIYQAALACKAQVLLTGDVRDFGFLMNAPEKAEGLLVQTVAGFLNSLP
ncbi:MAG: PIN domain-containing protein [Betaproteobacteria bacterium]|nr:PIN domain-containing protein [Betaproteobacteria bacterium]